MNDLVWCVNMICSSPKMNGYNFDDTLQKGIPWPHPDISSVVQYGRGMRSTEWQWMPWFPWRFHRITQMVINQLRACINWVWALYCILMSGSNHYERWLWLKLHKRRLGNLHFIYIWSVGIEPFVSDSIVVCSQSPKRHQNVCSIKVSSFLVHR